MHGTVSGAGWSRVCQTCPPLRRHATHIRVMPRKRSLGRRRLTRKHENTISVPRLLMETAMKNVTITLPEETLARLRVEAAKEGKSMSKFTAELIEHRFGRKMTQKEGLAAFLAGPDLPGIAAGWAGREELYAERLLRRHERDAVSEGPAGASETDDGARLDRGAQRA